ncbi:tetratricopeptide repeat protein [Aestuariirhabdus sp. LZHN29]|uniref:tetratricopeptide repeat protein n=1 Tax=Aestuariirhabdus sp. LZHN29 TaxID=3417462 RepID=UPI003CF30A85
MNKKTNSGTLGWQRHRPLLLLAVIGMIALVALAIELVPERSATPATYSDPAIEKSLAEEPMDLETHVHLKQLQLAFQQAVAMLHAREYEHAIVALHKVIEMEPTMPEAHTNMGFALLGLERYGAAKDFFIVATELDELQLNAYYGMALAYAGLELYPQAIGSMVTYEHRAEDGDKYLLNARQLITRWRDAADWRTADERFIQEVIDPTLNKAVDEAIKLAQDKEEDQSANPVDSEGGRG